MADDGNYEHKDYLTHIFSDLSKQKIHRDILYNYALKLMNYKVEGLDFGKYQYSAVDRFVFFWDYSITEIYKGNNKERNAQYKKDKGIYKKKMYIYKKFIQYINKNKKEIKSFNKYISYQFTAFH